MEDWKGLGSWPTYTCVSGFSFADVSGVAVQAWVGKEFPDTGHFRRE